MQHWHDNSSILRAMPPPQKPGGGGSEVTDRPHPPPQAAPGFSECVGLTPGHLESASSEQTTKVHHNTLSSMIKL